MKQEQIKALLLEASYPDCPPKRWSQICHHLVKEAVRVNNRDDSSGVALVTYELFNKVVTNRRDLLLTMLPVFTLMCVDNKTTESLMGEIDWQAL